MSPPTDFSGDGAMPDAAGPADAGGSPGASPIVTNPKVHWPMTALVGVVVIGFLIGAAFMLLMGLSRVLPADEVPVTLVDTNSYVQRSAGNTGLPTTVYEVIGVTKSGEAFAIASEKMYDAFITQMPVEGVGEVARITGEVVRVTADGVEGGGGTGTGIFQLFAGLVVLAMALFVAIGITRPQKSAARSVSKPAVAVSVAAGLIVGPAIAFAGLREGDATARQLAASEGGAQLPQDGQLDIGDIEVDVDISVPELDLGLETDLGLDKTVEPLPAAGAELGSFLVVVNDVSVVNGGVVADTTITNVSGEPQFEFINADLYIDGARVESDFNCADESSSGFGFGEIEAGAQATGFLCATPAVGTDLSSAELWIGSIEAFDLVFTVPVP